MDYGEYFESVDGKAIHAGISVLLDGEKIRPAKKGEILIGIISASPGVIGNLPME
ncbi:MAG TPA: peptidase G2 autoproteolytic cleavage domain-containing protein [bacterium]